MCGVERGRHDSPSEEWLSCSLFCALSTFLTTGMHVGPVMTSISEMAKVDLCSSDSKIVTVDQMASEACHYSGSEVSSYLQLVYNELWNTLAFTVCIKRPAYLLS